MGNTCVHGRTGEGEGGLMSRGDSLVSFSQVFSTFYHVPTGTSWKYRGKVLFLQQQVHPGQQVDLSI